MVASYSDTAGFLALSYPRASLFSWLPLIALLTSIHSVVVVPGVDTASSETWFEGKGKDWSQFLPEYVLPSPSVYRFNHGIASAESNSRIWSEILDSGLTLLELLVSLLKENPKVSNP